MRLSPLSLFGGKSAAKPAAKPVAKTAAKPVAKTAAKPVSGSGYIPDGLTPEQYSKFLAEEAKKADAKKKKFKIGKEPETLTEWFNKASTQYGTVGADVRKGHRLVKAKYEEFYTTENIDRVNRGQ